MYTVARKVIKQEWPESRIEDASDYIHRYRLQVDIAGVDEKDFWRFLDIEGMLLSSLGFRMFFADNREEAIELIGEDGYAYSRFVYGEGG